MAEENVQLVKSVYAAMKDGDIPGIFGKLAPDVKIWQTEELPWGGTYTGLEEAKVFFGKVNAHLLPGVALERFIDSSDFVIAIGRTQGTVKGTQKTFDVPLIHLWEVRDGRIAGLKVYLENATMKTALSPG